MPEPKDDHTHHFGPLPRLADRSPDPPEAFPEGLVVCCALCGEILTGMVCLRCNTCSRCGDPSDVDPCSCGNREPPTVLLRTFPAPTPALPTHGDLALKLSRARAALARIARYGWEWNARGRPVEDVWSMASEAEQALAELGD